jgi:hypothetical protein
MYARVITGQYQPGKLDEGSQIFRDSIAPATRQTQGFKGVLGLGDRSTGKAIAIVLRETEADLQATESSGFVQEQFAKLIPLLAGAPAVEAYEVSVQEIQQGETPAYARVLIGTGQLSKMDEGMQIIRDSVLPAARQQPGFKGGMWLLDRSYRQGHGNHIMGDGSRFAGRRDQRLLSGADCQSCADAGNAGGSRSLRSRPGLNFNT